MVLLIKGLIKLQVKHLYLSELSRVQEGEEVADIADVDRVHLGRSALGLGALGVEFCTAYRAGVILLEPIGDASAIESVIAR